MSKKSGKKQKSNAVSAKYSQKNKLSAKKSHEIRQAIHLAAQHHQAGNLQQAENIYQQVLTMAPDNVDANHLLGLIAMQAGNNTAAVQLIQKAIQFKPDFAEAHNNLGNALKDLGQSDEAISSYRKALVLKPDYAEAHSNLGNALMNQGKLDDAVASFEQALILMPDYAEAYNGIGIALKNQGKLDDAITSYEQALVIRPDYAEAHNNLGNVLKNQGKLDEAIISIGRALVLKPDYGEAHNNLGAVFQEQNRPQEAMDCYKQALLLKPDYSEAQNNLGTVFQELGCPQEAIDCFKQVLLLKPDYADTYNNLGTVLNSLGLFDEAISCYEKVFALHGDAATAHYNYSFALLLTGEYPQGWNEYEWRFKTKDKATARFGDIPRWQGEDLGERTLLVYAEQGIGDEIRYANCIPDVITQAKHVVIECDPRLQSLFQRPYPEATVVGAKRDDATWLSSAPPIDLQVPIGSLPLYTRTRLEDFPKEGAHLKADPERVSYWKKRVDALGPGLKVGVSWRSSNRSAERDLQYADFKKDWAPIFAIPGIQFINLQYDECSEELAWARQEWGVEIHDFEELDQFNDMEGVAGLMSALDLTISGVSAVYTLGGALNVPVWLMTPAYNVITLGTDHIPWSPSIRCFLKAPEDEWGQVTEKLAQALSVNNAK